MSDTAVGDYRGREAGGSGRVRMTRPRAPQQAQAPSPPSKPSHRLRPSVAMVTRALGSARAEAMQCEQMNPWAALMTSEIFGHNTGTTTPRRYRYATVTATRNFIHLSTDIHIRRGG